MDTVEETEIVAATEAVEEKKKRTPREKKPKSPTPAHPPYFEMIKEALLALDDKTGSSSYAIAKSMEQKHKDVLPSNYKKVLAVQLRNFAAKGKLIKVKASFKLPEAGKNDTNKMKNKKKDVKKENKVEKVVKESKPKKAKRSGRKKAAAPKPKQPKSIKKGAAKASA